jgi:GAF domain-containing protein
MPTPELAIQLFNGNKRRAPLQGTRVSLGRSSENDLAYPDDPVLSRRHLVFEYEGGAWWIEDLNTTNGSMLNGRRLTERQRLQPGDSIAAGRLTIDFDLPPDFDFGVTFVPGEATVTQAARSAPTGMPAANSAADRAPALDNIRRQLSSNRPVAELLPSVLEIILDCVGGNRGLILIAEHGQLAPRAMRGTGFRISQAVRDRVMLNREPILVLDTARHEVLSVSATVQRQRVKSLMAVPLCSPGRVLGLIYVDSQDEMRLFFHEDLGLLAQAADLVAVRLEQPATQG